MACCEAGAVVLSHAPQPCCTMHVQSLPLLGSMSNESFVLVNGGYEQVVTMQVGGQDGQGQSHIWWLSSICTALQPCGFPIYRAAEQLPAPDPTAGWPLPALAPGQHRCASVPGLVAWHHPLGIAATACCTGHAGPTMHRCPDLVCRCTVQCTHARPDGPHFDMATPLRRLQGAGGPGGPGPRHPAAHQQLRPAAAGQGRRVPDGDPTPVSPVLRASR